MHSDRAVGRALGAVVAIALVGLLVASVAHTHLESVAGCPSAICIHCGGGAAVQPLGWLALAPVPVKGAEPEADPRAPEPRYLRQLDHSGCAPPARG